ncbi:MAG: putative bifunctional diguanylate cyclase/phosphodiesterase [Nocardioidaceae bacterium]
MKLRRQRERTHASTAPILPPVDADGLASPSTLVAACTQALGAQADGANPALLVLDVEGVGTTTEQGGIAAREELLSVIVQRLRVVVGTSLLVARLGDHEFAVLLEDLRDPRVALDLAHRIVSTVAKPVFLTSQRRAALVVSCGIAAHDVIGQGAGPGELLRAADLAMREAKRAGNNRVEVCTAELIVTADERLSIGQDLRQALADRGLGVSYQPLVDIRDGSLIGFEALVRWSHPVHGPISPDRFVPLAEEFGLITEIGALVLTTATAQVQQWAAAVGLPLTVHVNVSAVDLAADGFVEMVGAALAESQLSPPQLVLELTESEIVRDLDTAGERLAQLHDLGVRVAVDDFGSGKSGMGYLQQLAVDILKVEESSGDGVDSRRADDLLRGVIAFGKALGMQVFGERIEDQEQRDRLLEHGCTVGQGYLFSRPLTPEDAGAYLRTEVLTA